jgi:peptidylprolyl isomerase
MKIENFPLFSLLIFSSLYAKELATEQAQTMPTKEMVKQLPDIQLISEGFGHIISKNLKIMGVPFDITQIIKGMQNAVAGKQSAMSEREWMEAISCIQKRHFTEQCKKNLNQAEIFLTDNAKIKEVISIEKGKVQYQILKQGNGKMVKSHFSPLIRYTLKTLDGSFLSNENEEESVCLNQTISGLKAGLVGMKEGEKRNLYIHPDLAYGMKTYYLPPNSLLIFEIEILKADTSSQY